MPDWSAEKKQWLDQLRDDALPAYRRLMTAGRLVISSEGREDIAILFPKHKFAHLCGFAYYHDRNKTRRASDEDFFDRLRRNRLDSRRVDYTHRSDRRNTPAGVRRERTGLKVEIAAQVFTNMENVSYVVDSAKSDIVLFTGDEIWSLGLSKRSGNTHLYIPASLLRVGILSDEVHRRGTRASRVTHTRWVGTGESI